MSLDLPSSPVASVGGAAALGFARQPRHVRRADGHVLAAKPADRATQERVEILFGLGVNATKRLEAAIMST